MVSYDIIQMRHFLSLSLSLIFTYGCAGGIFSACAAELAQHREGISWPEEQAMPHFAAPAPLDAIEVQALSRDEQIAFSALQGQINRKRPRIFLIDNRTDEGRLTWAQTRSVDLDIATHYTRKTKYSLLAKYAGELEGAVLYDPSISPHYRNLAGTIAALRCAIPVSSEILERCREHGINLKILVDLREMTLSSPLEIYEHLYSQYWEQCTKRLIVSARPSDRGGDFHHTRDLAAAVGAAVVWLDARVPEERDLLRKFYRSMPAGGAVSLGWYATERSGITAASEFGIGTLPADHYLNATVYSGMDHRIHVPPVPPMPPLQDKVYIALVISDGDNIQYAQRALRRIWDQSEPVRGRFPLNWTMAPGLVDIGPGLLNYYYRTATPNDCFVSGPSGMGYVIPFNTLNEPGAPIGPYLEDPSRMEGYARMTGKYLRRSGLRVITIWDDATPMQRAAYEKHCRNLYGATVQNFKDVPAVQGTVVNSRVRFEKLVIPYASTYQHIRRSITSQLGRWDRKSPLFLAYQASIWSELKPARLVELCQEIQDRMPDRVEFVRADHYFNLYNQAHDLPFNLALAPETKARDASDSDQARRVLDGSPTTVWSSREGGSWIEFDLGESRRISRCVIVRSANVTPAESESSIHKLSMSISDDGETWTEVGRRHSLEKDATEIDLAPIAARYLKLAFDTRATNSVTEIADIEIYGR